MECLAGTAKIQQAETLESGHEPRCGSLYRLSPTEHHELERRVKEYIKKGGKSEASHAVRPLRFLLRKTAECKRIDKCQEDFRRQEAS